MEEDDEFGDLYADVLKPVSSSSAPQPPQPTPQPSSQRRPIDLNLQTEDDEILYRSSGHNSAAPNQQANQTTVPNSMEFCKSDAAAVSINKEEGSARESGALGTKSANSPEGDLLVRKFAGEPGDKDVDMMDKDVKFDIEDDTGIEETGEEPIIPGLSRELSENQVCFPSSKQNNNLLGGDNGNGNGGEGDDWDSDSEDDLHIVLNDDNHGPMGMDRGAMAADDDEDDDDPLVIVADNDPNQPMEEQEWDKDAAQAGDSEKKEGEPAKASSGTTVAPKIGFSSHGYHPYHSQFKYVRPGAASMPSSTTAASGGASGQVHPLASTGPMAGRGRGDWRPAGIKGAPSMQKGFHQGYGMPSWGSGRAFGSGLEFTLPSHKTIFDVDIESFEEKPWRYPGVDISDFFNFGLNEESWKDYWKQLETLRLGSTMQSKIHVYESGRKEREYDPDMPPELAAASSAHEFGNENTNLIKSDTGQAQSAKVSTRFRPPLPTGRLIPVESGYGERLPSIDTRPPRMRESDAIIVINCEDNLDHDSLTGNLVLNQLENSSGRKDPRGDQVPEDDTVVVENDYGNGFGQTGTSKQRCKIPFKNSSHDEIPDRDGILPSSPKDGETEGRRLETSPHVAQSQSAQDKDFCDNQDEQCLQSSSPVTSGAHKVLSVDHKNFVNDDSVAAGVDSEFTNHKILDENATANSPHDEDMSHSPSKYKRNSQVEQPAHEDFEGIDYSKAARSSDNSKARSGSSRDYQKTCESVEEEVSQDGQSRRVGIVKRHIDDSEQGLRRRDHDRGPEPDGHFVTLRGREDPKSHRELDTCSVHHLRLKSERYDRRKERDTIDGASQQRDDDYRSRRIRDEDPRKRERDDEIGSKLKARVRERERTERDEYIHTKRQLDISHYRSHYDKDVGSRHRERDDSTKSRYEIVDDYRCKRRKDEEYVKRDRLVKEQTLHDRREDTGRRKQDLDDVDQRKRNDQQRIRETVDDPSIRHKEEGWLPRQKGERKDEWHRSKQSHSEVMSKREKEEGRATVRSGQVADDRAAVFHTRMKDENRGSDREYQLKNPERHSELYRGQDDAYGFRSHINNEEKRHRNKKLSSHSDRVVETSDRKKGHEKQQKDNMKNMKESESSHYNTSSQLKRKQEDQSVSAADTVKGDKQQGNGELEAPSHHCHSRKQREDGFSDDDPQETKRGRSKLERWTSHKERDFSVNGKSSSSLKFKEVDVTDNDQSLESNKRANEFTKSAVAVTKEHSTEAKNVGDLQSKDDERKPTEDRQLDTVEKLKKRSERFKLPMPGEKDASIIKKMESEPVPSKKSEAPADSEVKQERPARKRRWTAN